MLFSNNIIAIYIIFLIFFKVKVTTCSFILHIYISFVLLAYWNHISLNFDINLKKMKLKRGKKNKKEDNSFHNLFNSQI